MLYRVLGKTGLKVSIIGFGGIPIQRGSSHAAKESVLKAEESGINFIDSARGYTISEEYIGEALKGRRDRWILATKSMARDRESMAKDIETSLKNYQTDFIDLYQFHNIRTQEELNRILGTGGAYEALEGAKKQGKIGHIGITSHSVDLLKLAIETGKFATIMFPYNAVETQAEELFERAAELTIGVIAMKPLAGGALPDASTALRFILGNRNITTAIPGMATEAEVEANASVGNHYKPLTAEELQKISEVAGELGRDFCRRCGYCGPCPQGIDIGTMFLLEGYKKRYDLAGWAESRYFSCTRRAKDCLECGACEPKCPYDLPIRRKLKEVREIFNDVE